LRHSLSAAAPMPRPQQKEFEFIVAKRA
jgi:hypothetical protein